MPPANFMQRVRRFQKTFLFLALVFYLAVLVRNAWLSDDAYITFRTVDNFVHGFGLRWNVVERVQAYTHPLWMLALSAVYFVTREIFFSSLVLSMLISLIAVIWATIMPSRSPLHAAWGVTFLALSKAFVDYSTSGLENPLTHLLLALFFVYYLHDEPFTPRRLFTLSLLAALGMVNRLDTFLLYAPAMLYAVFQSRDWKSWGAVALGALPLVLWEAFSLFYYGFPFPNTAYAKLNAALIPRQHLVREGLLYLLNSLRADAITLLVIVFGVTLALISRKPRWIAGAVGAVLYVAYVVYVGGDFMSGRFLTAPLLIAVMLWTRTPVTFTHSWQNIALGVLLLAGLSAPYSPAFVGGATGAGTGFEAHWVRGRSIVDERANYYPGTGLLEALADPAAFPRHDWAAEGQAAREAGPAVVVKGSVGFFGYYAGPDVHIVDLLGLGDALLARLPLADPDWRIGHFGRLVPEGYLESLTTGENRIADPHLAVYYEQLALVTRGDLWDPARLRAIWALNTGAYDAELDAYAYFRGDVFERRFRVVNPTDRAYAYTYVWNNGSPEAYLLDDASTRGQVYEFTWRVTAEGVTFDGPALQKIAALGPLSDAETLNIGVFFCPAPDLADQDKYEYRYWFRSEPDGNLTIVLPGKPFHQQSDGFWVHVPIEEVMRVDGAGN